MEMDWLKIIRIGSYYNYSNNPGIENNFKIYFLRKTFIVPVINFELLNLISTLKPNLMKTTKPNLLKNLSKLALTLLILFAYSCDQNETDLQANTEAMKSRNAIKAKEIARGALIRGTNGINFGPGDNLYIASFYGKEVVAMNKQNGKILRRYGVLEVEDNPPFGTDDLIFHPDGESFYYTDITTGFVGRMALDGTQLGYQEVDEEYQYTVPIDAVRVNGDILVSELVLGGVVKASDGSSIAPLNVASGLATDGTSLWAADWLTGDVWRVDFDNGAPETPVRVAKDILQPEGMAFETPESLLVVETGTSSLLRIDLTKDPGENATTVVENLELIAPWLPGEESVPTWYFDGVAVGPSGDIYVTGGGANVLYRI